MKWENGRQSVLVTNIPADLLDAGEITKHYFDRWPFQEKQFRDTKHGVNIHRIVGDGKRCEPYEKMREKCNSLRERIEHLKRTLHEPLQELERLDNELVTLYEQERALREQSSMTAGKRVLCEDKMVELKHCERAINTRLRQKKTIEAQHKKNMKTLRKYMEEERRICVKDMVYRLDTE
ncbi:MAG: hypothetical protein GY801_36270 [bacterium]|nr:hypothetical protein [bacterium]